MCKRLFTRVVRVGYNRDYPEFLIGFYGSVHATRGHVPRLAIVCLYVYKIIRYTKYTHVHWLKHMHNRELTNLSRQAYRQTSTGLSHLDEVRRDGLRENRRRMHHTMITAFGGTPLEAVGIFLKEARADRQMRKSWLYS